MADYERKILNGLLDSYERSVLSRQENKVRVHIAFAFTRETIPEYFNESSLLYETIHACLRELEYKGFLKIIWKGGKENHIVQKVQLEEEKVPEIYRYLKRIPKAESAGRTAALLEEQQEKYKTPAVSAFLAYLRKRIAEGKTVKEFIDIEDIEGTRKLLCAIVKIEENTQECYLREFSVRVLKDSKAFEEMLGTVGKVFRRFLPEFAEMEICDILAEYRIYHTPNYVYFKGQASLYFERNEIDLAALRQGIGLSGEDLEKIRIEGNQSVKRVITVENLTTFFRWEEEDSILIYLGGYHNSVRRKLLQKIYRQFPTAEYLHFGDIDVGGFEIYEDLCGKTGIPFKIYHMGIEELKAYQAYAKGLTANDKKRLEKMLEKKQGTDCVYFETLKYMKQHEIKLEQECLSI